MATTYKILAQANPSANTDTTAYTVPAATSALVSSVVVCNQAATAITFRLAVRVAGAALAAKQYVYYDKVINGSVTTSYALGLTLGTGDLLSVRANSASVSFQVFGVELT